MNGDEIQMLPVDSRALIDVANEVTPPCWTFAIAESMSDVVICHHAAGREGCGAPELWDVKSFGQLLAFLVDAVDDKAMLVQAIAIANLTYTQSPTGSTPAEIRA